MKVPEQIKSAAKSLIDTYGDAFDYLGKYKGKDVFCSVSLPIPIQAFHTSTSSKAAKPLK